MNNQNPEPAWARQIVDFFPRPSLAISFAAIAAVLALISGLFAAVMNSLTPWLVTLLFACLGSPVAWASFVLSRHRGKQLSSSGTGGTASFSPKPTAAIFALLISIYSTMLSVAMLLFCSLLQWWQLDSVRYYSTIGIAIISVAYLATFDKTYVFRTLGRKGGRGLELTGVQSVLICLFVVGAGLYFTWLLS